MGNSLACVSAENCRVKKKVSKATPPRLSSSSSPSKLMAPSSTGNEGLILPPPRSSFSVSMMKEMMSDKEHEIDEDLAKQAIAAAKLFRQHQRNGKLIPFERSGSVEYPSQGSNKKHRFKKSSSSRQRSLADPLLKPSQLVSQKIKMDQIESKHFVLVHGGGFGAWCWYKIITLLEESGFQVDAIDLTGSGTHPSDSNSIYTLSQYVEPLVHLLNNLKQGHKVILVGHDIGGACVSYVMELFPDKIAKSIFIAAAMFSHHQSAFDVLSQQTNSIDLMRQAQVFLYANGKSNPPTAMILHKPLLKDLLFNQSSVKDIVLASVSMRPIPFMPIIEKLSLTKENYGSISRFYVKTEEDQAISISLQEAIIKSNPPEKVFFIKGSDHAPFFSKPQALHKILTEISQIPPKQA